MHTGEPKKQALPEKWLADLLSKALLMEYQQPAKVARKKGKRSGKKGRLHGKTTRAPAREGLENGRAANFRLVSNGRTSSAAAPALHDTRVELESLAAQAPWHLEDVPVFHLFAQVKRLLGRYG